MRLLTAIALLLFATPTREVQVRPGETLEDVARRELGDAAAAGELRALNALGPGAVPAGTKVKLPGKERERAVSALGAAKNALAQLDGGSTNDAARAHLAQAEQLFAQAKYVEAAAAADQAWRLVSDQKQQGSAFTVEVKETGDTRVTTHSGQPVRVEAQGVQKAVEPGQTVRVAKGKAPPEPATSPVQPVLAAPRDKAVLKLRPAGKGVVGPVKLSWAASRGASSYQVELLPEAEGQKALVLTSAKPSLVVPALAPGRYWWKVKAVGAQELSSDPSEARSFEVAEDKLKLEVRGTDWK